ncbi:MAG: ATP-binding cassette domain-containing protein [Bdellovibrionales bacterium]|nr:ATP-binding cassette domain-containing protein [Bdellovibrionales bacterium]
MKSTSSNALIDAQGLRLTYQSEAGVSNVLHGLDFQIERGEKVAICGPSGSGKSTLLYILGGLLRPTAGLVRVAGRDIWKLDESARAEFRGQNIGFVFQQFHLIPGWTVLQNAMLGAEYNKGTDLEMKARALIQRLGLGGLEDRKPNQLSGGQAQRVAIARALLMNPEVVLADEPTGALDSATAREIMALFDQIHRDGKTVIIITHDEKIAATCDRVIRIEDGRIPGQTPAPTPPVATATSADHSSFGLLGLAKMAAESLIGFSSNYSWRKALSLLSRNRSRSLLTLFGIAVGIAAVVSMISIGGFAKERILDSYTSLGIRNFKVWGYPNWGLRRSTPLETYFREFKTVDLETIARLFPQIRSYTPLVRFWSSEISYAGVTEKDDISLQGLNEWGISLQDYEIDKGRGLTAVDIDERNGVCVLGSQVAKNLKIELSDRIESRPLVFMKVDKFDFACRVVGVLKPVKSSDSSGWEKPGFEVFAPYTFLRAMRGESANSNQGDVNQVVFQVHEGVIPDDLTSSVKSHLEQRFGLAGEFRAEAKSKLILQMRRFLDIFNALLATIAFITLLVGATGVTNMILVSLSERVRELGIRRAVGAQPKHLRQLVLSESLTLCAIAGGAGLVAALVLQHLALYATSLIFPKVPFAWVFDPFAIGISLVSIVLVGIGSGLYPALKVEQQDVVSALRAE